VLALLRDHEHEVIDLIQIFQHLTSFQSPETQIDDVLERHQQKNGRPRAPHPAELTAVQNKSTTREENNNAIDDDPERQRRAPHHSQQDHNQPAPPNQIGHYGPVWKDCLEEAKMECRAVHALSNPWPKLKMDMDSLADSLSTVVMQWNQRGVRFEPGKQFLRTCCSINLCFRLLAREEDGDGTNGKHPIHTWNIL